MAPPSAPIEDLEAAVRDLIRRDAVQVPPYPGVALRLQQLVASGNYGMGDVAEIVMTDPVVTGFLLRAANSAAFRGVSKISSVPAAVSRLGGADVMRVAIAASLGAEAGRHGPLAPLRRRFWQESLTAAVVSFHLASVRKLNGQEGFTCGLLHDIGRVVAVSCIEKLLVERKDTRTLPEAEWLAFVDAFHVELGTLTALKWGLSDVLQTAISAHHRPEIAGLHKGMVDVVRAADGVVSMFMNETVMTREKLAVVPGLSSLEVGLLFGAIGNIGSFVASLDESMPTAAGPQVLSQVFNAALENAEPTSASLFDLKVLRTAGESTAQGRRVRASSLGFLTQDRLPERYLVKLRVLLKNVAPFEVHAFVETCAPVAGGFEVDARLFALSGAAKDGWATLLGNAGLAAGAPAAAGAVQSSRSA